MNNRDLLKKIVLRLKSDLCLYCGAEQILSLYVRGHRVSTVRGLMDADHSGDAKWFKAVSELTVAGGCLDRISTVCPVVGSFCRHI